MSAHLIRALKWRSDVEREEMIEQKNYTKAYCGFPTITSTELNAICEAANLYYKLMGSTLRIGWSMGELIPAKVTEKAIMLDKAINICVECRWSVLKKTDQFGDPLPEPDYYCNRPSKEFDFVTGTYPSINVLCRWERTAPNSNKHRCTKSGKYYQPKGE